jgi:undecaprenyl-diphosphatase
VFRRSAAAPLAAAYAALAGLVAAGALTRADQWAVDHLMLNRPGPGGPPSVLEAVVPLYHASWHQAVDVVGNLGTVFAQAFVSSVLLCVCCLVLWRRGRRRAAIAWAAGWLFGNAVEVLCKSTLARPLLHRHGIELTAFESSFPSGHTLRAVLLASAAATVWPATRVWAAAWAVGVVLLLELDGLHVPSDIAGGVLLAALVVTCAQAAENP